MAYAMGSGSGGGEDDVPGSPPPTVGNVSPFLWKTYNLVSDERTDHILSWTSNGRAFTVWRPDLMERELLPKTFKHSNFASFVRQLNNYGFHKVHSDRYEFAADGFQSGRPDLLHTLKRHDASKSGRKKQQQPLHPQDQQQQQQAAQQQPFIPPLSAQQLTTGASGSSTYNAAAAAAAATGGQAPHQAAPEAEPSLQLSSTQNLGAEVEQLKRDRYLLLKEVVRLREQNRNMQQEVQRLNSRVSQNEHVQEQVLNLLQHLNISGSPTHGPSQAWSDVPRKRGRLLLDNSAGEDSASGGALYQHHEPPALAFKEEHEELPQQQPMVQQQRNVHPQQEQQQCAPKPQLHQRYDDLQLQGSINEPYATSTSPEQALQLHQHGSGAAGMALATIDDCDFSRGTEATGPSERSQRYGEAHHHVPSLHQQQQQQQQQQHHHYQQQQQQHQHQQQPSLSKWEGDVAHGKARSPSPSSESGDHQQPVQSFATPGALAAMEGSNPAFSPQQPVGSMDGQESVAMEGPYIDTGSNQLMQPLDVGSADEMERTASIGQMFNPDLITSFPSPGSGYEQPTESIR